MPKYSCERLISFDTKGYMDFMKYDEFRKRWKGLRLPKHRHLLTFLYFTGSRPVEVQEIMRGEIKRKPHSLNMKIPTAKRREKGMKYRIIDVSLKKFPEVRAFWDWIKDLPDDFYLFGWLRLYKNASDYIIYHLDIPAMFFRHNANSLLALAGASEAQIMAFKGAKSKMGVYPYLHLNLEQRKKLTRIHSKAFD